MNYLSLFLFLGFISCHLNDERKIQFAELDTPKYPKILPYTEDSSIRGSRQEPFVKNLGKLMGLPLISGMNSGVYVRIWLWSGEMKYVLNISDSLKEKTCSVIKFKGSGDSLIVIHHEWMNLIPKSGWEVFLEHSQMSEILNLQPGRPADEQRYFLTEMAYVQFEISRNGQYRFFEYYEPSFYRFIDTGSMKVYNFLKYFNREMNLNIYNPADSLYVPKERNR